MANIKQFLAYAHECDQALLLNASLDAFKEGKMLIHPSTFKMMEDNFERDRAINERYQKAAEKEVWECPYCDVKHTPEVR